MIIFFRNIPENTTQKELHDFIKPALTKFGFIQIGKILEIKIFASKSLYLTKPQWNALISVDSEKTFKILINKLKKKPFKNKFLIGRKYRERSENNDPRKRQFYVSEEIQNRRIADRRKRENIDIEFESSNKFSRKLGDRDWQEDMGF